MFDFRSTIILKTLKIFVQNDKRNTRQRRSSLLKSTEIKKFQATKTKKKGKKKRNSNM